MEFVEDVQTRAANSVPAEPARPAILGSIWLRTEVAQEVALTTTSEKVGYASSVQVTASSASTA